jgi:hypothetical protein
MKKKGIMSLIFLFFFIFLLGLTYSYAQTLPQNLVAVELGHGNWYHTKEDSTQNVLVTWEHEWRGAITNLYDLSNENVNYPTTRLTTNVPLTRFFPANPFGFGTFTAAPPNYTWNYNGLIIKPYEQRFSSGWEENPYISAKTKFSARRSIVPEILTGTETLQAVTFEFTLEEALPPELTNLLIRIGSPIIAGAGTPLVQGAFISATPVDGWTSNFDPAGATWNINPSNIAIGKLYIFEAVLKSTKSTNLAGAPLFKPGVLITYGRGINYGLYTGASATYSGPDGILTGTFTAANSVTWRRGYFDNRFDFWFDAVVSQVIPNPDPPPPYIVLIPATVRLEPEALKLNKGVFTAFVNLPQPYDIRNIDVASIKCEGASPIRSVIAGETLILKFAREDLIGVVPGEDVEFEVKGRLLDGSGFKGDDVIRVIKK